MKERVAVVRAARERFYALRARHKEEERLARDEWEAAVLNRIDKTDDYLEIAGFYSSLPYKDGSSARSVAVEKLLDLCDSVDKTRAAYRKRYLWKLGKKWDELSLAEVEVATTTAELVYATRRSRPFDLINDEDRRRDCSSAAWFVVATAFRKFLSQCPDKEACKLIWDVFDIKERKKYWATQDMAKDAFFGRLKELGWEPVKWDRSYVTYRDEKTGVFKKRPRFFFEREQEAATHDQ